MNILKLTDVELVALQMLFDREKDISCESRANDDYYPNGRPQSKEEIILDKISYKVCKLVWKDNRIPVGKIVGQLVKWVTTQNTTMQFNHS